MTGAANTGAGDCAEGDMMDRILWNRGVINLSVPMRSRHFGCAADGGGMDGGPAKTGASAGDDNGIIIAAFLLEVSGIIAQARLYG